MTRPRNTLFFETPLPQPLPESMRWLQEYDQASKKLIDYLVEHGAGSTAYHAAVRCLTDLRDYLVENELSFSLQDANKWLYEILDSFPKGYPITIRRLTDLLSFGIIQPVNAFPNALPYSKVLRDPWHTLLAEFLDTLDLMERSVEQIKNCVSRFLYSLQQQSIMDPARISYNTVDDYLKEDEHRSDLSKARYTYSIGDILLFFADKGLCRPGLGWYPYFWRHECILRMADLSEDQRTTIRNLQENTSQAALKDIVPEIKRFLGDFQALGYSKAPLKVAYFTLHNLLLFLDMHDLDYQKNIADIWLEAIKGNYSSDSWKQHRRVLDLFDRFFQDGVLDPKIIFTKKPRLCDSLASWCRCELDAYMSLKLKEGWEPSTLDMIRSSVTRFCIFLEDQGVTDFTEITPKLLSSFNLTDKHSSAEGKNAYNSRIRKFLCYLERKEVLPYGIHLALMGTSAPTEKIVVVLTESEKEVINQRSQDDSSPMILRDNAIMLLGLCMGLRASDIVNIRLEDIDWKLQTLRILQEKTDHEIILPIPVRVANAIYRYIKFGRANDKTASAYLFIKNRVPYDSVGRTVCRNALNRAIPDRSVSGSGFHVTRKTYATDRLRSKVGKYGIADLLGQRDTQSLNHYLLLDKERMKKCPISLEEADLLMKGGRYGI